MKVLLIVIFTFFSLLNNAQKQGNIWYFGEGLGLDFNFVPPNVLMNGQIDQSILGNPLVSEGCASISDSIGNLLFYTNGNKIWDKTHNLMPNGDSLLGHYSSSQSALFIPLINNDSLYYLFTTDAFQNNLNNGLRYSIVNNCLNNGQGDISFSDKNILLLDTVSEKLVGVYHSNDTSVWLICHKYFSDKFYSFLISENGIVDTTITSIGSIHTRPPDGYGGTSAAIGQMKASPNGNKLAIVFSNTNSVIELFDFDRTSGIISNLISLPADWGEYGLSFSPDNSKLYVTSGTGLWQYDLLAGGGQPSAIIASKTNIPYSSSGCSGGLQLGPDGKVYVIRCNNYLGVINSPNSVGLSCNYVDNGIYLLGRTAQFNLPSFIDNFIYKNGINSCMVNDLYENKIKNDFLEIYPNPFYDFAELKFDNPNFQLQYLFIYNIYGQLVKKIINKKTETIKLERDNLSSGIYILQLIKDNHLIATSKLIIE